MAEFLDPNWQQIAAANPYGQAEMPGKVWDSGLGAWIDPAYTGGDVQTFYEGDPEAAYALAVSQAQGQAQGNAALPLPVAPVNMITTVIIPTDGAGGAVGGLNAYRMSEYGLPANKLGDVRSSSTVLVGERTGVRPGVLPRIVLPIWARNDRGGPL